MRSYQISVKDRGRVVIPTSLRREAGLSEAVELVATPLPGGGFTVKTRQQILEALWEKIPSHGSGDVVSEFLAEGETTTASRIFELENPVFPSESEMASREADILATLGL